MKNIETEILINASASKVWNVLMDFESYSNWNPFILAISGSKVENDTIETTIQPPGGKQMTFKPRLLKVEQNKEFRWKGKFLVKGVFDGEHYFILKENGDNQIRFIHGENFSGILIPLMGTVLRNTKLGFEMMNQALKKQCEK